MWPVICKLCLLLVSLAEDIDSACQQDIWDQDAASSNDILLLQLQRATANVTALPPVPRTVGTNTQVAESSAEAQQLETFLSICSEGVEDCGQIDVGSCAHSCCVVEAELTIGEDELYRTTMEFLNTGRGAGAFRLVAGELAAGNVKANLMNSSKVTTPFYKHVFQFEHVSDDARTETINMNFGSHTADSVTVRAMSISDQFVPLADQGQNYKNLMFLMKAIGIDGRNVKIQYGCGAVPYLLFESLMLAQTEHWVPHGPKANRTVKKADVNGRRLQPLSATEIAAGAGQISSKDDGSLCTTQTAPYCNHADVASCGNSCCMLDVYTTKTSEGLYHEVKRFLESGGTDGSYAYVRGSTPPKELVENVSFSYVTGFQGTHVEKDTGMTGSHMYFGIREFDDFSILRAHVQSDDPQNLYDGGQSFKTLHYMLAELGYWNLYDADVVFGCTHSYVTLPQRETLDIPTWVFLLTIGLITLTLFCQDKTQQEKDMLGRESSVLLVPD